MTTVVTTIDLLRHGKPEGGEMFRGHTDVALSEEGWQQMRQATAVGPEEGAPWQRVVYSPLSRCKAFAQNLATQWDLPSYEHADFREISFGDWDGKSFELLQAEQPEALKHYWRDPINHSPPNGEPMEQFQARLQRGWQSLLDDFMGEHVLLVAHGGVIRVLLAQMLDMPMSAMVRFEVPYACMSRLKIYHREGYAPWPQLVFHAGGAQQEQMAKWYQQSSAESSEDSSP